jgi:hypothetical protein
MKVKLKKCPEQISLNLNPEIDISIKLTILVHLNYSL